MAWDPRPALLGGLVLLLLLTPGDAAGGEAGSRPPRWRGPAMTALSAGPLGRAGLVALGRTVDVRGRRGVQIASLRIERVLQGESASPKVTVLTGGPRPTQDERAPSVPYLEANDARRYVFFLKRGRGGKAWYLLARFEADGLLGAEKVKVLEGHIAAHAIPDPNARARATQAFLLALLEGRNTWSRVHAARELNHLARVRPDVFTSQVEKRLRAVARRIRTPTARIWLVRLLKSLACVVPVGPASDLKEPPAVADLRKALQGATASPERVSVFREALAQGGAAALAVVIQVALAEPTGVTVGVLDLIGEGGYRNAAPLLRARYAQQADASVQAALVRAVGRVGTAKDVPWLAARLANPRVRREAMFSLARIRTPQALSALRRLRDRARADPTASGGTVPLAEYLLGETFVEVERDAGRSVGTTARPR
ncbi:MAG: HEAT repeat domain-containing protein [Planctomycetota bacterium]